MKIASMETHKIGEGYRHLPAQHLMLIDGNVKQRGIFSELLTSKLRYQLTEASTSHQALHNLNNNIPVVDLILLDLSTVEDGYEVLANLKGTMPDIPIIVLVQYGDYRSAAEALLLGAMDFLTKPVAEERMNVTLRNCIQLRNAKKEALRALSMQGNAGNNAIPVGYSAETLISLINTNGDTRKIEEIETAAIRFAIRFYNGRMTEVARKLGIGRSTLYRKLETIGGF